MKKIILLTTMLLAIVCGFAQVSTKTETTEKEDGNKQITVTVKSDGKTTTIDTVITLNDGQAPNHLSKKFKTKKGTHLTVKIYYLLCGFFLFLYKNIKTAKTH